MKHPNATSLAKRLLDSHIKRQVISGIDSETEHLFRISDEERAWAEEILATHLDACMKQGIHPDLTEAVADALAFALRREKAYEPIPTTSRLRYPLVFMEEQVAD
jgi:hypothetical protein